MYFMEAHTSYSVGISAGNSNQTWVPFWSGVHPVYRRALLDSPETRAAESGNAFHRNDGALDEHEENLLQGERQALLVLAGRRVHLEPRHDQLRGAAHAVLEVGAGRHPTLEGPLAAPQPRLQHRQEEVVRAVHAELGQLRVAPPFAALQSEMSL